MPDANASLYQELSHAASYVFSNLLSEPAYKTAVRALVGEQVTVETLGLPDTAVQSLASDGIVTAAQFIDAYEGDWLTSRTYQEEAALKLEEYIRSLLAAKFPAPAEEPVPARRANAKAEEPDPDAPFIQCEDLDAQIAAFTANDMEVEALDLSARSLNALKRTGIDTVSAILKCTAGDICQIKNLGKKSRDEIYESVKRMLVSEQGTDGSLSGVNTGDPEFIPEPELIAFRSGAELFREPSYRDTIIALFEEKAMLLEDTGLPPRSGNALIKKGITAFAALLAYCPDELETLFPTAEKTRRDIQKQVDDILKRFTAPIIRRLDSLEAIGYAQQEIRHKILSLYQRDHAFHGFSFQEFRDEMPECVTDAALRAAVSDLMRSKEIEYVDFRCYRVYPRFETLLSEQDADDAEMKYVLLMRLKGQTLRQIADSAGKSAEWARLKEIQAEKWVKTLRRDTIFDEDYNAYLFDNYEIPKEAWLGELGCSEIALGYFMLFCENECRKPAEDALDDPAVTVNQKYRLQKYLERQVFLVDGEKVKRDRVPLERFLLERYCRDEMPFESFAELYNGILRENHVPENSPLYDTPNNRSSCSNRFSKLPYALWTQGGRLRYYDTVTRDFSELLATLDLAQYRDVELSADKFMMEYPELMERYDIRNCHELHVILKKIVDPALCQDIDFSRQPMIRFGNYDRAQATREIIEEFSPITTEDLIRELQKRYGYSEDKIRNDCITAVADLYHKGVYTVHFKTIPEDRLSVFQAALTGDFYLFEELREIYHKLFPDADVQEVNPRMLKQMGFVVNRAYAVQHFRTAEEYLTDLLTRNQSIDMEKIRKKHLVCYNTLNQILNRLLQESEVLYDAPEHLIHFRQLEQQGVTKEMLRDFCDKAIDAAADGKLFTIRSLRAGGFRHSLDSLGFSEYFYNALLANDARLRSGTVFGGLILCKGTPEQKPTRNGLLAFLISGKTTISIAEIEQTAQTQYGIDVGRDKYDLTHFTEEAAEQLGMYYDRKQEKVYRDKSYYYEDLEKEGANK